MLGLRHPPICTPICPYAYAHAPPQIYSEQFKGVFNDVTNGSNPGCGTAGFQTAPGWDPVTGLGTLNFERLLEQFLALP